MFISSTLIQRRKNKSFNNRIMKTLSVESGETSHETHPKNSMINGVVILEFLLRFLAAGGTLASAMTMGTADETVPLLSQSIILNAKFSDLPMFTFFVIANSVACAYLVLSLPLSFYHIIKGADKNSRLILITFDTAMLALVTAGASAAASIVYLAHEGNAAANWSAVCQQLNSFCERTSASLITSFVSAFFLILVIVSSVITISHR